MKAYRPHRRQPTRVKLAQALAGAGAPAAMIAQATDGYYDDFRSPLGAPIVQLVHDAEAAGLPGIAARAQAGEFDGQRWEAEAWAKSPEGRETFAQLRRHGRGGAR